MVGPVAATMAAGVPLLAVVGQGAVACDHGGFRSVFRGRLIMGRLGKCLEGKSIGAGPEAVPGAERD
jgi:hypothetical protein